MYARTNSFISDAAGELGSVFYPSSAYLRAYNESPLNQLDQRVASGEKVL